MELKQQLQIIENNHTNERVDMRTATRNKERHYDIIISELNERHTKELALLSDEMKQVDSENTFLKREKEEAARRSQAE